MWQAFRGVGGVGSRFRDLIKGSVITLVIRSKKVNEPRDNIHGPSNSIQVFVSPRLSFVYLMSLSFFPHEVRVLLILVMTSSTYGSLRILLEFLLSSKETLQSWPLSLQSSLRSKRWNCLWCGTSFVWNYFSSISFPSSPSPQEKYMYLSITSI